MGLHGASWKLVCLLVVTALLGCRQECDEGSSWCEGNTRKLCNTSGGGDFAIGRHYVTSDDCGQHGLACYQAGGTAYCGIADASCPSDRAGVCVGNTPSYCPPGAEHPAPVLDCDSFNSFCVVDADGGAVCSQVAGTCDADIHTVRCFIGKPYRCERALWRPITCGGDPLCGCQERDATPENDGDVSGED